ncbi:ABC transporter ATP-binding protein [Kitasatospora purpeofusca]|uniref:ABC transporter ATP-binding protein n=1 Tax=Kitasatospora purpeofusca TaxID=67352 RepID=A0ABZ1UE61_9ACTN|nr:ABC transporter ATP-binding protein [Kitasatospora purpeofusca]
MTTVHSTDPTRTAPPPTADPVIELVQLARSFPGPPPVDALHPTDLTVRQGDYLAVTGPSGSGKSTLLNLLGLLDRPTSGIYRFCGTDLRDVDEAGRTALRGRRIGFVFQSFHLVPHRTTVENVALAQLYVTSTRRERRERRGVAESVLRRVGLAHRLDALPTTLSGGERQRVAVARALVNAPDLLLCDEPTGNLDSGTAGTVLDLIDELHGDGVTVIVITHDPGVAARASRRVAILDGRISHRQDTAHGRDT